VAHRSVQAADVSPVVAPYFPAAQSWQPSPVVAIEYLPAAHCWHDPEPQYSPSAQSPFSEQLACIKFLCSRQSKSASSNHGLNMLRPKESRASRSLYYSPPCHPQITIYAAPKLGVQRRSWSKIPLIPKSEGRITVPSSGRSRS